MYQYLAYGLGIHSIFPLFDIPVQAVNRDIAILKEEIDLVSLERNAVDPYISLSTHHAVFSVDGVGRFQVSDGARITVDPDQEADGILLQRYIIGACMAMLLYQREQLVLHASAVNINGRGVAFMGFSGAGKSSVAAGFLGAGYELLVDDVTSIDIQNYVPYIYPGFPYIKLAEGAPSLSYLQEEKLEFSDHLEDKTGFRIKEGRSDDRVPLECIYVIKPGKAMDYQRYDFQHSLIELVRYSLPPSMVRLDRSAHFNRCVQLVNKVPVYELRRPANLSRLPELVDVVENHLDLMGSITGK